MHFSSKRPATTSLALSLAALGLAALGPRAAHAQTQDLFVSNGGSNTISRFAGTGPGTFAATPTTLTDPQLSDPIGLTFDAHGDLFASNTTGNTLTEFTAGATPGTFGAATTFTDPSLNKPEGLAFDAHGDLLIANYTGNNALGSITEFAAGATPGTLGAAQVVEAGVLDPAGLAFDSHGDLFATIESGGSNFQGSIMEFAAGATPGTFGAATTFTDPSVSSPRGLTFDAHGDLFVASQLGGSNGSGSITEFAAGATPGAFGAVTTLTDPSLFSPQSLAFDALGDLYTANFGNKSVTEFASTGAGTFGAGQVIATGLNGPSGIAFDAPAVPEASTTASFGLLLALGMGGLVIAAAKRKKANA